MKTKLNILLILLLLPVLLHAQENPNINRTLNWRFGGSIGINFDLQTQEVNFLPLSYWFGTYESASTMSDEEGNLLFYTDGELVFNSEDTVMPDINFVDDKSFGILPNLLPVLEPKEVVVFIGVFKKPILS